MREGWRTILEIQSSSPHILQSNLLHTEEILQFIVLGIQINCDIDGNVGNGEIVVISVERLQQSMTMAKTTHVPKKTPLLTFSLTPPPPN
mmetsp:Transcript_2846/g.3265  ORF Transcript_2846/g.3265 Transcript_2846/m.3265 type:complete len:90 (-) Transcript_2846:1338-1607(-)